MNDLLLSTLVILGASLFIVGVWRLCGWADRRLADRRDALYQHPAGPPVQVVDPGEPTVDVRDPRDDATWIAELETKFDGPEQIRANSYRLLDEYPGRSW